MDLFATYDADTYELTGFFSNQPLANFVILSVETRDYIVQNEAGHKIIFQEITPGMLINNNNVKFSDAEIVEITQSDVNRQIATLQQQIKLLATQVLTLSLQSKGSANAPN